MDTSKLKEILTMHEEQLQVYLDKVLASAGYQVSCGKDEVGNILYIYATKPDSLPVLLIAHTDTVHDHPPRDIYYDELDGAYMAQNGLGADDRAGIFAILELININCCDALFTSYEEKESLGAKKFINDYHTNPGYNLLLQLDCPGENKAMFYDNRADEFQNYILEHGYVPADGKASDIKVIAPAWGVNAVNLSTGYYNHHKRYEQLNLEHLNNNIVRVNSILSKPIPEFVYK